MRNEPGTPIYIQIQKFIREEIAEGKKVAGDRLPSEQELAQQFDTTRATVARALQELVFQDVIVREVGKGTFVAPARITAPMESTSILSFEEQLGLKRGEIQYKVIGFSRVKSTPDIANCLQISDGDEVIQLERVRVVKDLPLSFVTRILPVSIGSRISADSLWRLSIHDILRDELGIVIDRTVGSISAVPAPKRIAEHMDTKEYDALLVRRYTMYSEDGVPCVTGTSYYRREFELSYGIFGRVPGIAAPGIAGVSAPERD